MYIAVVYSFSHFWLWDPMDCSHQAPLSMGLPSKSTGVGCNCHSLPQGIFPTQGSCVCVCVCVFFFFFFYQKGWLFISHLIPWHTDLLVKVKAVQVKFRAMWRELPATDLTWSQGKEGQTEFVKVLVIQSCPALCDPMDCSLLGSSIHGILQARILEWVAIPFSRGSFRPRDWTQVSCITGRFFTIWATREAPGEFMSRISIPQVPKRATWTSL